MRMPICRYGLCAGIALPVGPVPQTHKPPTPAIEYRLHAGHLGQLHQQNHRNLGAPASGLLPHGAHPSRILTKSDSMAVIPGNKANNLRFFRDPIPLVGGACGWGTSA